MIAMPDERWGERPLLVVVPKPGTGAGFVSEPASRAPSLIESD